MEPRPRALVLEGLCVHPVEPLVTAEVTKGNPELRKASPGAACEAREELACGFFPSPTVGFLPLEITGLAIPVGCSSRIPHCGAK